MVSTTLTNIYIAMEENKTEEKLTYEQLEKIAIQMQNRAINAERRLESINMASLRLEYLFKTLSLASMFPKEFIDKCVSEVVQILDVKEE